MRCRTILIGILVLIMGAATAAFASDFSLGAGFWSDNNTIRSEDYTMDYSRSGMRLVAEGQKGALGGQVEVLTGKLNTLSYSGEASDYDASRALEVTVVGLYHIPVSKSMEVAPLLGYSIDRSTIVTYNEMTALQLGNRDGFEEEWAHSGIFLGAQATMRASNAIGVLFDVRYTPSAYLTQNVYDSYDSSWYKLRYSPAKGTKTQWRLAANARLTPVWGLEGGYTGSSQVTKAQEIKVSISTSDGFQDDRIFTVPDETITSNSLFLGAVYRF